MFAAPRMIIAAAILRAPGADYLLNIMRRHARCRAAAAADARGARRSLLSARAFRQDARILPCASC